MNSGDKKCAVFLDIDGTLMGKNTLALEKNLEVIKKVRSLGHKVFANTGRATGYMPKQFDVARCFDGIISGVGARITLDGEEVFCKTVPMEVVRRFCEFCVETENISILEGIDNLYYCGGLADDEKGWVRFDKNSMEELLERKLRIEKFTILGEAPKGLSEALGDDYPIIQHPTYAEIVQRECGKAVAMEYVLKLLNIERKFSIAMGDSLNDFDMIEYAGIGVAMGNAVSEIKDISSMVTEDVDKGGVAQALEKIFNIL